MDKADRTRYRQLANDAVIATFGESGLTAQLAEALEKCVDDLDYLSKCPICSDDENPDWAYLFNSLEELGFRLEPL